MKIKTRAALTALALTRASFAANYTFTTVTHDLTGAETFLQPAISANLTNLFTPSYLTYFFLIPSTVPGYGTWF